MQHRKGLPLGLLAAGLLASAARGQQTTATLHPLLHIGDTIIGMGALEELFNLAITDQAMWVAYVDTNFPENSQSNALLRNGFVTLREGVNMFDPPGAVLKDLDSINLSNSGDLGLLMTFSTPSSGNNAGMFWNLVPAVVTGDPVTWPGIPAGATWSTLLHGKMNENREMLVFGTIVTPGSGAPRHTLARYEVDGLGALTSFEVLASKGLPMPALGGDNLNIMPTNPGATALNDRGDYICVVDGAIGEAAVMLNMDTVLAQVGFPSPNSDLEWKYLDRVPRVAINDFGDYVFSGSSVDPNSTETDAAIYMMVKNGELFAKEGEILGPFTATPMGKGSVNPIFIANSGDVYWYWQNLVGGSATEFALMRNYTPIIQTNVTRIGTNLVQGIPTQDNFGVSGDGRFWIGRVNVQVLGETVIFVDFGVVVPIPGCNGNPGKLSLAAGLALPGEVLTLAMDNGQAAGVRPVVFFSTAPRIPGSPCGANTPYGELLINMGSRFGRALLPSWNGTDPSLVNLSIPDDDLSLVNLEVFAQGMFIDINHTPADDFRLTNALRIQIGAP